MDWVRGESLRDILKRGGVLPAREAASVCLQAARGLAAAHAKGIVHRDVKPGNIMVEPDGHVRVVDFGLARLADIASATWTGGPVGTVAYMSPEQVRGERIDEACDVWALAAVLYESLAGRRAFPGESMESVALSVLKAEPDPLANAGRGVPQALCAIVERAFARDPARRTRSMETLAAELSAALREIDAGVARPARHRMSRRTRRVTVAAVLIAAAGLAVGGAALTISRVARRPAAVAVLPFVSATASTADRALAALLRENLSAALVAAGGMQVVDVSANATDPAAAAQAAGARWILEGSVLQAMGHIRVSARLLDTRTRQHTWAQSFDRSSSDLLAVQDEIVGAVVRAARGARAAASTGAPGRSVAMTDQRVLDLIAEGDAALKRSDRASLRQAWQSYDQAVTLTGPNARALAGRGTATFLRLSSLAADLGPDAWDLAVADARAALALDPYQADAGALLAARALYAGGNAEAAGKALDLIVSLPQESRWAGERAWTQVLLGRLPDAIRTMGETVDADPTNRFLMADRVRLEAAFGDIRSAASHFSELVAFNASAAESLYATGAMRMAQGRWAAAQEAFAEVEQAAGGSPVAGAMSALAAARQGNTAKARAVQVELSRENAAWEAGKQAAETLDGIRAAGTDETPLYVPQYAFAVLALAQGDESEALQGLTESARLGEPQALDALVDPGWEGLRAAGKVRVALLAGR